MFATEATQNRVLVAVAVASASLIHISIAASQVSLGFGILLLLFFRGKLEFPRVWVPLAAFFLWTALADVLSPDPWGGRAQVKKFFVFLFIPLVYGVFRHQFSKVYYLIVGWALAATASGTWAIVQYLTKYRTATYQDYVGHRITGFESHWMTFSALQLSVLSLLLAQYFFSDRKLPLPSYLSVPVLALAILLSGTRSIWLAAIPAVLYLVWFWRPKMMLLVPVVLVAVFFLSPPTTRQRLLSLVQPKEDIDSNSHRVTTFRTGIQMVGAHPWFGIGPEQIRRQFDAYVPSDIKRPLPVGYYGHLHNIYLQYAAERGIPGLILLLWVIGLTIWDCARALLRLPPGRSEQRFLLHGTLAVIIGILVGGIFEYNLGDSEVLMMFVSVVSLGYLAVANAGKHAGGSEPVHSA
jgi:putative inorganic carbon (HCO3(-)) transporter